MRTGSKVIATGVAVAMLGVGGVAAHSGRYDTARLARIARVEMGPGCRAHPESRWCARHYAALARARTGHGHGTRGAVRYDTRRETALANLAERDRIEATAWQGGPAAEPPRDYAARDDGDATYRDDYDAAPLPPPHGWHRHRHRDCDCGDDG